MRKFNNDTNRDYFFLKKRLNYEYIKTFNSSVYNEFQCIDSFSYLFYKRYYLKMVNYGSRFRVRCVFTGRFRGTQSYFSLSRMLFKKLALNGFLIGIKKASW